VPTRKQRRRREKLQRHEYEYVLETEEGEEVPLERSREREADDRKARGAGKKQGDGRRAREIPKPSFQRVAKRTAIFAPLILLVVWWTSGDEVTTGAKIFTAVTLLAFFIPFSYMVDVLMYRFLGPRRQAGSNGRR
jgi:hypothetical protein